MAKFEFTMVSAPMLRGLLEAGATGSEMAAYILLVMGLPKDRRKDECFLPADTAEEKLGMSVKMLTKCLTALTRKYITIEGGGEVPVITKTQRGRRGHCAHYRDNLGRLVAEGLYPPSDPEQQTQPAEKVSEIVNQLAEQLVYQNKEQSTSFQQ